MLKRQDVSGGETDLCHLEISPSPFKWEVSGRAPRTVGAGEQSRKSPGPAEGGREREKQRERERAGLRSASCVSATFTHHSTIHWRQRQHQLPTLQRWRSLCARTEHQPLSRSTAQRRECGEEPAAGRKRGVRKFTLSRGAGE